MSIINGVNGGTAVFVVGDERDSIIKAIIDLDTGSSNPLIYLIPGLAKAYDINISLSSSKSDLGSRIFCVDTLPQVSSTSSPSLLLEKEFYQDLKSINSSFYSSSNLQITLRAYVAARFAIQAYSASSSSSTSLIEIIQSVQEFAIPSKEMAGFIFNPLISSGSNCTCPIMELRVGSIVSNNNLSFYNYQTSGSCDDYSPSSTPTAIFLHFYNLGYRYSLIALGSLGVMITLYCIYWIRKNQAIELIRQSNPILLQTLMVISLIIVQVETMTGNSIDAVSCMLDVWIFYPCFVITIATLNAQSVRILAAFRHETAVSVNGKKIVLIRWAVTNNSVGGSGGGGDDKTAATMAGLDKFWVVSTSVLTSIYVVYLSLWTALAPSSLVYIDALGSGAGYGRVCSLDQGRVYELPLIVSR